MPFPATPTDQSKVISQGRWCINSKDVRISEFKKETASEAMTNSNPVNKANYRVMNWAEYDQALVNRGDVTVWFDQAYLENNWVAKSTGKRGAPKIYPTFRTYQKQFLI